MQNPEWLDRYFEKVTSSCAEGQEAVAYARAHRTRVGIKRARKSVGAFCTLTRSFYLNEIHYTPDAALEKPRAWSLFIHEVCHLKQGLFTALSIYGEMEAWQLEFRAYKKMTGKPLSPVLEELLSIPLGMNRNNLRRVRDIMTEYAGKGYGANFLPLYPIHKEIKYWVTRKEE